jgi:hypothetical protein
MNKVKSKIVPYAFSMFSIGFVLYLLIGALQHYLNKYIF